MPITGTTTTADIQLDEGVNANSASTTEPLTMYDAKLLGFYVVAKSGAHTKHVAMLQISPDGVNWFDTTHTVTGVGNLHDVVCAAEEVRIKITTLEGATSTVDITIIIK